jgi:lipopolysaccharide export LptBFGC system permease protein LptF
VTLLIALIVMFVSFIINFFDLMNGKFWTKFSNFR